MNQQFLAKKCRFIIEATNNFVTGKISFYGTSHVVSANMIDSGLVTSRLQCDWFTRQTWCYSNVRAAEDDIFPLKRISESRSVTTMPWNSACLGRSLGLEQSLQITVFGDAQATSFERQKHANQAEQTENKNAHCNIYIYIYIYILHTHTIYIFISPWRNV